MTAASPLINLLPYRPAATGLSRYVERLLAAWPGATGQPLPLQLRLRADGEAELSSALPLPARQHSRRLGWLQANALVQHAVPVGRLVHQANPSLIYSPYTDRLLAVRDRPQVITCHDLIPLYCSNSRRAYWRSRLWLPLHLHGATRVIAISGHVADLLVENGLPADRIEVVPNGVEAATDPVQGPGSADVLVIARHARNKNLSAALEGFACFLRLQPSWEGQLLLVGRPDRITPQLKRLAQELGLQGRVEWIDGLSEPALEQLLRRSFCLLSCSLMEGFDYPLLEAQARGIPTLASRIPVHSELHREHALLFEVGDGGASLGGILQQLARDSGLWQQLSQAGPVHAQQFSLCRQVKQIAELLASIQP